MNITYKRFFILFSVALNIGFLVTALILYFNHSHDRHQLHMDSVMTALNSLNLDSEKEKEMMSVIKNFEIEHDEINSEIKNERIQVLSVLAQPGPIDSKRFAVIKKEIEQLDCQRHAHIHKHIFNVRERLGDENGARFFSALLSQIKTEKKLR